ncbi:MAG TPA: hypothetical protein PKO06_04530 [Candidatus Ozemobacteraceae bacterium]|nr:hypothetical protein [Candidatus Ozemobacteraceae bacterium]
MNQQQQLLQRSNITLLLLIGGLFLGLALTWEQIGYGNQAQARLKADYAAELLAHGLDREAAEQLEQVLSVAPDDAGSARQRRVLADLYLDRLGDHEKALAHLVHLRRFHPDLSSGTEDLVRRCLDRLGRVYDVQRRHLLDAGINPVKGNVASDTVVKFGAESGIRLAELQQRLVQLGVPLKSPPPDVLNRIVQGMVSELLLKRAAVRSSVDRDPKYLEQVRAFEQNLLLQRYLEDKVLKDVQVDEQALQLFLEKHQQEFSSPLRVVYSSFSFPDEAQARDYLQDQTRIASRTVVADHVNAVRADLPRPLQGINFDVEKPSGPLGPIEIDGAWHVFVVHDVVPGRQVSPELARQQARLRLLEEKQGGRLTQAIQELARQEEVKILDDVLQASFGLASTTAQTPELKQPPTTGPSR